MIFLIFEDCDGWSTWYQRTQVCVYIIIYAWDRCGSVIVVKINVGILIVERFKSSTTCGT